MLCLRLLVVCAALLVLAPACSFREEGGDPVARVGARTITERDVEGALEHFREEAEREGKDFPDEDAPEFERVRAQALGVLVYQAQVEEGARRLGVRVSEEEVERRAERARASEGEDAGEEDREAEEYLRGTIRSQLAYSAAYRRLTRHVVVGDRAVARFYRQNRARYGGRPLSTVRAAIAAELLQVKRNQVMERWLNGTRAQLQPRYVESK